MIDLTTWARAWALLTARERRQAWLVLLIIVLGALAAAAMVGSVMPFLVVLSDPSTIHTTPALAWANETFGFKSAFGFLVALGLASFTIIVVASLIQILRVWAVARFSMMRIHSISLGLLTSYLSQPYEFFLNRHSGEMSPRVLVETEAVVRQFFRPAAELIASFLTSLAIICLLLWVDPVVASVAFIVLAGSYGVIYFMTRRTLKRLGEIRLDANSRRFRLANEALTGIKDIKLLGRETTYLDRYAVPSTEVAKTQAQVMVLSQVPQFSLQALSLGGVILLCLLLIDREGIASGTALGGLLPTLGVFAFAGQRMMPELSKLYQALAQIQASSAAVDAIYEDYFLGQSVPLSSKAATERLHLATSLKLHKVSYSYPNASTAGLQDISLEIAAGEKIGIVGGTGAGKTTLADIILGLLEPNAGQLSFDGVPLTPELTRSWMRCVGYVPQDIFLTDAPIRENIALGVPADTIDDDRVERAAKIAQIHHFIRNDLADGYQTSIGERGVRLSGGQRQRIGIARALYNDADLIVFDEATSALDNLTEAEVMEAINALPGDKTVVLIAHRLSTVERCDRIVVVDQGRIVGCDSWVNLMSNNLAFQRIVSARAKHQDTPSQ